MVYLDTEGCGRDAGIIMGPSGVSLPRVRIPPLPHFHLLKAILEVQVISWVVKNIRQCCVVFSLGRSRSEVNYADLNDRINFNTGCISMYPDDETAKVKFPDWYINIKIEWRINVFTLQYPFENKHNLYRDLMYLSGEISCVLQCWETSAVAWVFLFVWLQIPLSLGVYDGHHWEVILKFGVSLASSYWAHLSFFPDHPMSVCLKTLSLKPMDQYQYGTYEFWTYELEVQLKGHVLFNW